MRARLAAVAAGVVGATVLTGGTSAAAADCQVERLQEPGWAAESEVKAGSPSGSWLAGEADDDTGRGKPLIWHDGRVQEPKIVLPQPDVTAISSTGLAVGVGSKNEDSDDRVPFAFQDGKSWRLPTLNDDAGSAVAAISPDGRAAVGSEAVFKDGEYQGTVPVRWSGKKLQKVQQLPGDTGRTGAAGIDGDTVVGASDDRAYVWSSEGKHGVLPKAPDTKAPSTAEAVRGKYAVGYAKLNSDDKGAVSVLWNLDRDSVSKMSYSVNSAEDVNSSGVAAASTRGGDGDAAVVEDGEVRKLPSLGGAGSAFAIADDGVVAGLARNTDEVPHAVVWQGCAS